MKEEEDSRKSFGGQSEVYALQEDYKSAIDVFTEALEFSAENAEVLTTLGILSPLRS